MLLLLLLLLPTLVLHCSGPGACLVGGREARQGARDVSIPHTCLQRLKGLQEPCGQSSRRAPPETEGQWS